MAAEWRPVRQSRTHELVLERIEEQVVAGELKAGDRLPPERELAPVLRWLPSSPNILSPLGPGG